MSSKFSVYVGPYVVIPRSELADWSEYEDIVIDGQFEAGVDSDNWYLIPQDQKPYGRKMRFDNYSDMCPTAFSQQDILVEWTHFHKNCRPIWHLVDVNLFKWGVVPCIS